MIPDCIVWKTLTSHVSNLSHTHTTHTFSFSHCQMLISYKHIEKNMCTPLQCSSFFSNHKHTCSYLHLHATCVHNTYRSIYELHDTSQKSRFTVTHRHRLTHSAQSLFDDFKSSTYYPHEKSDILSEVVCMVCTWLHVHVFIYLPIYLL